MSLVENHCSSITLVLYGVWVENPYWLWWIKHLCFPPVPHKASLNWHKRCNKWQKKRKKGQIWRVENLVMKAEVRINSRKMEFILKSLSPGNSRLKNIMKNWGQESKIHQRREIKCKTDYLTVPSHPVHKILRMSAYIGLDPIGNRLEN